MDEGRAERSRQRRGQLAAWFRREGIATVILTGVPGLFTEMIFGPSDGFSWGWFLVGAAGAWVLSGLWWLTGSDGPKEPWWRRQS